MPDKLIAVIVLGLVIGILYAYYHFSQPHMQKGRWYLIAQSSIGDWIFHGSGEYRMVLSRNEWLVVSRAQKGEYGLDRTDTYQLYLLLCGERKNVESVVSRPDDIKGQTDHPLVKLYEAVESQVGPTKMYLSPKVVT